MYLFGVGVTFNTVQVISRWVLGRAEETSTYSWSRFCNVNCRPSESYQVSHLRKDREPNPNLRVGRRECYHSATVSPPVQVQKTIVACGLNMQIFLLCVNTFLPLFWSILGT